MNIRLKVLNELRAEKKKKEEVKDFYIRAYYQAKNWELKEHILVVLNNIRNDLQEIEGIMNSIRKGEM